ncbi:uncharacterized protein LOC129235526 isoform X1 [Anastrepha obliqua]|uniref:uncharacterized protein LOC129235526 isoform X1 n=2 Tax=Anastrepha obliqua TaxID=95512 RepID=UPI00240A4C1D|nr:uncharacterized protein LOC129235526 isoform X1 [Anastrepha obliqua]
MATKRGRGEGDVKRKIARLRLKNVIRSVMINRIWLVDVSEQKLSLNVKKNIAMLIRPQHKVGILTMAEKMLLRTHPNLRSIDDRKKLVNLIASLTCFSRIPPKVRARLVPVIKFMFLGPGRKIIKEGDPPSSVYFILSGEVELYRRVYDRTKNAFEDKLVLITGPGDCLGDIEMIEECPRTKTCISRNEVELLVLHGDDFDKILRPIMTQQWQEKKAALLALEYFKYLNHDQIISACRLALIRQFDPLETILYEDKGYDSYVHFVISGECMILQCLKVKVTLKTGGKIFELVNISECKEENLFQGPAIFSTLRNSKEGDLRNGSSYSDLDYETMSEEDAESQKGNRLLQKMDIKSIQVSCGVSKMNKEENSSERNSNFSKEYLGAEEAPGEMSEFSGISSECDPKYLNEYSIRLSNVISKENIPSNDNLRSTEELPEMRTDKKQISLKQGFPTRIENHFIDVGSITFGGVFSLGEKLEHRVIMARTTVQCLMLPRYWLLEKEQNPGNIWQRRRFYLNSTIPSREQLFKDFLTTRTWQKFKNNVISSNLTRNLSNPTKVQDIPIICRIVEPTEY